jgi:hypothetical protein
LWNRDRVVKEGMQVEGWELAVTVVGWKKKTKAPGAAGLLKVGGRAGHGEAAVVKGERKGSGWARTTKQEGDGKGEKGSG